MADNIDNVFALVIKLFSSECNKCSLLLMLAYFTRNLTCILLPGTLMLRNKNVINVRLPMLMLMRCQKSGSNDDCTRSVLIFVVVAVTEGHLDLGR
jgi:hypothetical protein